MKILIVHPNVPIYGGAERVIVKFCEYLRNKNTDHAIWMPGGLPDDMRKDLKDSQISTNLGRFRYKADIINYHNFPVTVSIHTFNKCPKVWLCNEPPELFTNFWRKPIEAYNRFRVRHDIKNVIVADKFNARRFFDIYTVVPHIIPYGIDYEFFNQVTRGPTGGFFTVMQVGTISRYKNQLATVRAVAEIKDRIKNVRLWLIGNVSEDDYKRQIEDYISHSGLGGIVSWEPHVSREHLRMLYSLTDVLVHPVREQGGWLTPFEAISAGVPVIVSNELTCADMIKENRLGQVTDDYARVLLDTYSSRDSARWVTGLAKDWVKKNLTWDKFGENMTKYFREVLECRKSLSRASPGFWVRT